MQIKTAVRNDYGTAKVNTVPPPNADEDAEHWMGGSLLVGV